MHEVKLPQLGQTVEEAAIVQWLKVEGDNVEQGEPLFSVQTDKAEIECESPAAGVLRKILVQPNVTIPVLSVVALIGNPDEKLPDLATYEEIPTVEPSTAEAESTTAAAETQPATALAGAPERLDQPSVSPRAAKRAKALNIDISTVSGTGPGSRILEDDVLRHGQQPAGAKTPGHEALGTGAGRRIPLTPMRRLIAERMCHSFHDAPHYYLTAEVDMGAAKRLRQNAKGFKPSFNDIILYATAQALRKFPSMNARWMQDAIEELDDVNLGFAVAVPSGLVVPVVRQAQDKTLEAIHRECRALIKKALHGKLLPDDCRGNTFTVSNLGSSGIDQFTAIINPPDSAILAVGQIKDKPVVVEGDICIRPVTVVTLSSDHRVIDGALAAQFMDRVKAILENGEFST